MVPFLACKIRLVFFLTSWSSPFQCNKPGPNLHMQAKVLLKQMQISHRPMHASLHAADDPDWLLDMLALGIYKTSMTLTPDPPGDVDVEECEYGHDNAEDGGDEVFYCHDPSGGRG